MMMGARRDDAAHARLHPVMLAAWIAVGYSTDIAAGWIRARCSFPHCPENSLIVGRPSAFVAVLFRVDRAMAGRVS
jgi:hypothetical protein